MIKFLILLLVIDSTLGQTLSPTTIPGIATLRPTMPTMAPMMIANPDRDAPENKTEELAIVTVYFIMLGVAGFITFINIIITTSVEKRKKIPVDDNW